MKKHGLGKRIAACAAALMLLSAAASAETTLHLTFVGDCTLGSEEATRAQEGSFVSTIAREGYDWPFAYMQEIFQKDDLTVVNLEGVLSDSSAEENKQKTFRFRGPTDYVEILTRSGIDAVNLANNHTHDFGAQGYAATQAALTQAGVGFFGGAEHFIFEKNGVKIAFYGFAPSDVTGNKQQIAEELARVKREENVSAVVVTFHAGSEYSTGRIARQAEYAHFAIDAGADLVIMHHPHVLQGMEVYQNRSICYSLGNFAFGGNARVRSIETVVVDAALTFDEDGTYLGQQLTLYPANMSGTAPRNNYQPVLVSGKQAQAVMRAIQHDTPYRLEPYTDEAGCAKQLYYPAVGEAEAR